jgi:glycosyltransferase A (GT-A) superfamily protein (DUF2064 family)
LLIFAKVPVIGRVKTRLKKGTGLSDKDIIKLYRAFLKDVISSADSSRSNKIFLSYYPKDESGVMEDLIRDCFQGEFPKKFEIFPQEGKNFDERFTNAVEEVLKYCRNVVVIGSDSPHIQSKTINKAIDYLENEESMVLGPSNEGGVYLIGVSDPLDFTNIFSKGIEIENLVRLATNRNLPLKLLEELTDLDVSTDLISFMCNIEAMLYAERFNDFHSPKNTIEAVKHLGLSVVSSSGGERGRRLKKG